MPQTNEINIHEAERDLEQSLLSSPSKPRYKSLWTWPIRHPVLTIILISLAINLLT